MEVCNTNSSSTSSKLYGVGQYLYNKILTKMCVVSGNNNIIFNSVTKQLCLPVYNIYSKVYCTSRNRTESSVHFIMYVLPYLFIYGEAYYFTPTLSLLIATLLNTDVYKRQAYACLL